MLWTHRIVVYFCLNIATGTCLRAVAQDTDAAADFALSSMQSSLEKLVSGVYRASGTINGYWYSNAPVTMEWTAYSSFDYSK